MRLIILFVLLFSYSANAEELKADGNHELTKVLSNLVTIHPTIHFEKEGYSVLFYGVSSDRHCAAAQYCRKKVELLVVTTELGDEGPVSSLYRLPEKHNWTVDSWRNQEDNRQAITLISTTFESNEPDSKSIKEKHLLKTTFVNAEIFSE